MLKVSRAVRRTRIRFSKSEVAQMKADRLERVKSRLRERTVSRKARTCPCCGKIEPKDSYNRAYANAYAKGTYVILTCERCKHVWHDYNVFHPGRGLMSSTMLMY